MALPIQANDKAGCFVAFRTFQLKSSLTANLMEGGSQHRRFGRVGNPFERHRLSPLLGESVMNSSKRSQAMIGAGDYR
jgi:hypothetical protein